MAGNDNNRPDYVFQHEKNRKGKQVIAIINQSEEIWNIYSEKRAILHRLYDEQLVTSDTFTAINLMENDYGNPAFLPIFEEVLLNLTLLEKFEEKLDRSGEIVRDFIRDMRGHLAKMRKELNTVMNAETVEDLDEMHVPTLKWVESFPDPEIEKLADVWDKMRLNARATTLLEKLRALD